MTPDHVKLVQDSFAKVVPIADKAADLFYDRLFTIAPEAWTETYVTVAGVMTEAAAAAASSGIEGVHGPLVRLRFIATVPYATAGANTLCPTPM